MIRRLADIAPFAVLAVLTVLAAGAVFWWPQPADVDLASRFLPPTFAHPFGTDALGRDMFRRLIEGGQVSLLVGFTAAVAATLIGTCAGIAAGYCGGRIDAVLMRITDILIALPALPLLMILSALDPVKIGLTGASDSSGIYKIVFLIALIGWTGTARLVRARVMTLKHLDFIIAARALGSRHPRIILRHILPNTLNVAVVAATLAVGHVILMESVLSFLGLGIQPPTASWGNMLSNAEDTLWDNIAMTVYPGMMIFITVLSCNFAGDRLQLWLDPRHRRV